jgi:hypothetical protein
VNSVAEELFLRILDSPLSGMLMVEVNQSGTVSFHPNRLVDEVRYRVVEFHGSGGERRFQYLGKHTGAAFRRNLDSMTAHKDHSRCFILGLAIWKPTVAIRIANSFKIPDASAGFVAGLVAQRLEESGLFDISQTIEIISSAPVLDDTVLNDLRLQMREKRVDLLLNLTMFQRSDILLVTCQIVGSESGKKDFFSQEISLTPEWSVLLQQGTDRMPGVAGSARLVLSIPIPSETLCVQAVEADGESGDELVLLEPDSLTVFSFDRGRLRILSSLPLFPILRSEYPTRSPDGMIISADADADGREDIIASSNLWSGSVMIVPDLDFRFDQLDFQICGFKDAELPPKALVSSYRPGEHLFSGDVRCLDSSGSVTGRFRISDFRSITAIDSENKRFLSLTSRGRLMLLDEEFNEAVVTSSEAVRFKALATIGRTDRALLVLAGYREYSRGEGSAGDMEPRGDSLLVARLEGSTLSIVAEYSTALDIRDISVYNPAGFQPGYITVLGIDPEDGGVLRLYQIPGSLIRSQ